MILRRFVVLTSALALTLTVGCRTVTETPVIAGSTGASLYTGVDRFSRPIQTNSREAQRWFDQGMQFLYGFNHDEAIRSFKEAAARDPDSPMPWWGVAYAHGMNINDRMMNEDRWRAAWDATVRAQRRIENGSEVEQALVRAISKRYSKRVPRLPDGQRRYDETYAAAMEQVFHDFPHDADIAALYAESLMDLQPWDYWTNEGEPKGRILDAIAAIESALETEPDHPGAMHFYIHAMEVTYPEAAVPAAERLANRVPGAGHLVHMPSHIYIRVGRYADAADINVRAVAADRAYLKVAPEPSVYWIYYAHNLHFIAYASMMEGRYEPAIQAARDLDAEIPEPVLRQLAFLIEGIMPTTFHVMVRFGKWEEILAEPEPADFRLVSRAVRHYARGIAYSALGRTSEARAEIEAFEEAVARVPDEWMIFNNSIHKVLPIARAMLEGELLFRDGQREEAFSVLRQGIAAEDALIYDEPPGWMLPVRHALGALLMSAGKYAQAEQVYREDQEIHTGNGWSLLGLQQALAAQGRTGEANAISPKLASAWARVEKKPTSSCMCEPGPG